jgi:hypothetical protein
VNKREWFPTGRVNARGERLWASEDRSPDLEVRIEENRLAARKRALDKLVAEAQAMGLYD